MAYCSLLCSTPAAPHTDRKKQRPLILFLITTCRPHEEALRHSIVVCRISQHANSGLLQPQSERKHTTSDRSEVKLAVRLTHLSTPFKTGAAIATPHRAVQPTAGASASSAFAASSAAAFSAFSAFSAFGAPFAGTSSPFDASSAAASSALRISSTDASSAFGESSAAAHQASRASSAADSSAYGD